MARGIYATTAATAAAGVTGAPVADPEPKS
jgi:hypothetical protein